MEKTVLSLSVKGMVENSFWQNGIWLLFFRIFKSACVF